MHIKSNGWPVYKIMTLYLGAVIGAGFASGQEILQFFIVFGAEGIMGVALATLLFSYLGGLVMILAVTTGASNYSDIYIKILGNIPGRVMDILSTAMLPGGLLVMLAGGGAVFSEHLGLPGFAGTALVALVTIMALSGGLQGVVYANAVLVPLKVVAILLICIITLIYSANFSEYEPGGAASYGSRVNWAWSAILYVSYNMVVPLAVLSSLGRSVPLRAGLAGGMLGGVMLGALAAVVTVAGLGFYPAITGYEVPLLFIAGHLGNAVKTALGFLIWLAILTTAIAEAHGFASRFARPDSKKYRLIGIGTVLLALPASSLKFSDLVAVLYPLFGYAGLVLLFSLLFIVPVRFIRRKFF